MELLTDLFNSSADFEVVGTSDVAEGGVSGLAKTKAEILLLDLVLPDRGGIEILAALQESHSKVKTVIYSGRSSDLIRIEAFFFIGDRHQESLP